MFLRFTGCLMVLAIIGIGSNVVSAVPPAPDLASFLNSAVEDGRMDGSAVDEYTALSADGRAVADEAWAQIAVQAPARYLDAQTAWLVDVVGNAETASQSCCFIADLFAAEGYSSALSAMPGGSDFLEAKVSTQGLFATGRCTDCSAITGWLLAPNGDGSWVVRGFHKSRVPNHDKWTLDIVYID